jgi:uncharacterized Zn-binding protein involved in type VI secretion
MPNSHVHGNERACGATTIVVGQNFVKVNGKLWSVEGDINTDGGGQLNSSNSWLKINGKGVIVNGDTAAADNKCPIPGGAHCAPNATGFDPLIKVS